jgi:hypothetical protein
VAVFLLLLVGWVVLAIQLNSASAGSLPYSRLLWSNLRADYGRDQLPRALTSIRLTILDDAMRALGLTEAEVEAQHDRMELAMDQPVPTATAMDFDGAAPYTATPTRTYTPTDTATSTPTNTATATRRPPTRTPTRTKTPNPTQPPSTPAPTNTPSGGDTIKPVVDASGANFSPPPGDIFSCVLTVTNVRVTDAIGSSGIDDSEVGIKYDPGGGYIYLGGMTHTGGFQADTSWDAIYSGTFTLTGFTVSYVPGGRVGLAAPHLTSQHLDIYVYAYDIAGNFAFYSNDFDYDVYVSCT